jgi:hypothetical protein
MFDREMFFYGRREEGEEGLFPAEVLSEARTSSFDPYLHRI